MAELREFFAMGGYAFYVWSSFAITAILLIGIVAWSARQHKLVQRHTFARAQQIKRKHDA